MAGDMPIAREMLGGNATVEPRASGGPGNEVRNAWARVWTNDGDTFEVLVRINGHEEHLLASGTAKARSGKRCSLYVRTRGEADVDNPPAIEPEILEEP